MDRLSHDLIALILGYVPTPQRLAFASLACKRWRAAAIAATTSAREPRSPEHAVRILTALEHLELRRMHLKLSAPDVLPRLRSLSLGSYLLRAFAIMGYGGDHDSEGSLRCLLKRRTTLTSVELEDPVNPLWHTLLLPSAPSLASLKLTVYRLSRFSEYDNALRVLTLDLPSLTALSIHIGDASNAKCAEWIAALKGLIARTHTRLESLSVELRTDHFAPLWTELASLPFPRVTRLSISIVGDTMPPAIPAIAAQCHPSVRLSYGGPLAQPLATPALTELRLSDTNSTAEALGSLLPLCLRLTAVSLVATKRSTLLKPLALFPVLPLITRASASAEDLLHLGPLTALTALTMSDAALAPRPPLPPPFASVTSLTFNSPIDLPTICAWLALFPRLRTLHATLALTSFALATVTPDNARALAAAVPTLEHVTLCPGCEATFVLPRVTVVVRAY